MSHEDLTYLFCRDDSTACDEGVHNQEDDMVQQLNQELSLKGMIYSKNCIQLTKVVGQGKLHSTPQTFILTFCYAGESGLVYCGYLDSGGDTDMVAIKTCRGSKY